MIKDFKTKELDQIIDEVKERVTKELKALIEINEKFIANIETSTDDKENINKLYLCTLITERIVDIVFKLIDLEEGNKEKVVRIVMSEEDKELIKQQLKGA